MPRTAPTFGGTPTYNHVSFHFMDASGDRTTVSADIASADATNAKIEAVAAALGAASNAVLYRIVKWDVYNSVEDSSNATDNAGKSTSVFDHLTVQMKSAANRSVNMEIPAPVAATVIPNTDSIDGTSTILGDALTAFQNIFAAGSYSIVGVRYVEKSEINQQVKF